jgi:hypothetical protein
VCEPLTRNQEIVMVPIPALWLPILVSAVAVFVLSSLIHMVLGYHAGDKQPLPAEDEIMAALGQHDLKPGDYIMPHAGSMEAMKDPAYLEKREQGPVGLLTIMPSGQTGMGKQLTAWFVFSLAVSTFAAYIAGRALAPGAEFASVLRFAGAAAFGAYAFGTWAYTVWWGQKWTTSAKNTLDGLIYGLATGAVFALFWPGM